MKTSTKWFCVGFLVLLCLGAASVGPGAFKFSHLIDGPTDTPSNGEVISWNSSSGRAEWAAAGAASIPADLTVGSLTVTNAQTNLALTASRLLVTDSAKRVTNSTVTATEAGYLSGVTSGLQSQINSKVADTSGTAQNLTLSGTTAIGGASTINVIITDANPTNVINLNVASATNILNGAITFLHATNGSSGVTQYEKTHVRWLWAGGADRTLTIPSGWKTNVNSAVPASITNGTITKMYVTSIGDTSSSANQTNVFVSFEFYK